MKVLLVNIPTYLTNKAARRKADTFPMGLLYVGGMLLREGHKVELFDILAEDLPQDEVISRLQSYKTQRFDVIGISGMSVQYIYIKWLTEQIRKIMGNIPVIVGGAAAIHSPHVVLKNSTVDYCVTGEGEQSIAELLSSSDPRSVNGVAYLQDGEVRKNRDMVQMDIDKVPFPAYHLLNFDLYKSAMQYTHLFPDGREEVVNWVSICSARGCPYSCKFCSLNFPGYRPRDVASIKEEIGLLQSLVDFNYVVFTDELPLISKKRTIQICDLMQETGLYWSSSARANILDRETLQRVKDSGGISLSIGIETGSQRLLDAMEKKNKIEKVREVLEDMCEIGVLPSSQLIFGYPGEDEESVEETYKLFDGLPITNCGFYFVTPFPGSPLYDWAIAEGYITNEDEYLSRCESGTSELLVNMTNWTDAEYRYHRDLLTKRLYYAGLKARHGTEWVLKEIDRSYIEGQITPKYAAMILDTPCDGRFIKKPKAVQKVEDAPPAARSRMMQSFNKSLLGRFFNMDGRI